MFNLIEQRTKINSQADGLDQLEILEIVGEVTNALLHL